MRDSLLTKISGRIIILAAPLLILSCADTSPHITDRLPTAYADYTGEYRGFSLVLDERFEKFNPEVWSKGDGAVGSESICRFQPQGVEIANGQLNLIIRKQPVASSWSADHQSEKPAYEFSCGELRTQPNKQIKYGRFETRMKAPNREVASGYISSFFTYTHTGEPKEWEEIDIELEGGRPDKFQANLIYGLNAGNWWGTRQWGAWEDKINIAPADEWRVYAIEWTPKAIKWFVDGQLYKTLTLRDLDCKPECMNKQTLPTPIPDNLTQLMMNFWIPNDNIQDVFGGDKKQNVYPMTASYDWVRIYQLNDYPLGQWSTQ